jgi:hypothetical protein
MDTKKLVVGQKVWMQSGDLFKEATVTEITENYVRVEIARTESENGYCIDFRYDGVQCGVWGRVPARRRLASVLPRPTPADLRGCAGVRKIL